MILCDESHYLKSGDANRTKLVLPLLKSAKRRILLSGTPALSRPAELHTQLEALGSPIFKSFHQFGLRFDCFSVIGNMLGTALDSKDRWGGIILAALI